MNNGCLCGRYASVKHKLLSSQIKIIELRRGVTGQILEFCNWKKVKTDDSMLLFDLNLKDFVVDILSHFCASCDLCTHKNFGRANSTWLLKTHYLFFVLCISRIGVSFTYVQLCWFWWSHEQSSVLQLLSSI